MGKKLFVGNLSFAVTSEILQNAFSQFGNVVSATVVTDRETGRSRGFGFVEMDDADAAVAIEKMNGADLNGRNISVSEARPKPPGERGGGRGGFGGGRGGGGSRGGRY
ncbi:MAG: RNA-binding protein [Bdellovibrionaceae bacterium]|nr:RNA-binding protein [Pseudobdellovibrionaceae bacterium]